MQTAEAMAYARHRNLKIAAEEIGIPWQTLYVRLKKQGVPVSGDKLRYGTDRDRLGALAESMFASLVPAAQNMNDVLFQAKYDFTVMGHKVDVKSSKPRQLNKRYSALSWSFSFKKQTLFCDFVVCFCMSDNSEIEHVLLVPSEFFKGLSTVSVSCNGGSKWLDYSIDKNKLSEFFEDLGAKHECN